MIKAFTILILFTVLSACTAVDKEFTNSDARIALHKVELEGY